MRNIKSLYMCVKLCVNRIDLLQIDYVNALMLYLVASAGKQSNHLQ